MAFGLDIPSNLPQLEDQLRNAVQDLGNSAQTMGQELGAQFTMSFDQLRSSATDSFEGSGIATAFDGGAFRDLIASSGLGDLSIRNLSDLALAAERLPGGFGSPDSTGEVPTGSDDVTRPEAAVLASLAAAPRIAEALGPTTLTMEVQDQTFVVGQDYVDPVSGFSGLRLDPVAGGAPIFAVDGLEVGSRADEVTAATLGRLQVESPAFAQMVADATAAGAAFDVPVQFTGASLGGAVAQVAAYETAQALVQGGHSAADEVRLVTVDSLGGRDAAEAVNGGSLDPAALNVIEALNIRTDGDVVSRIGSQIGATLTLPGLDANGNVVTLSPADAHVNIGSLLQNLSSDERFAQGVHGAPAEISGFAAVSDAAADQVIAAWIASGQHDDQTPTHLQMPGTASFDPTGTVWSLDADNNGSADFIAHLSAPIDQAHADLVLG